jgi:hypothetical protein
MTAADEDETPETKPVDRLSILRPILKAFAGELDGSWEDLSEDVLADKNAELSGLDRDIITDQLSDIVDTKVLTALKTVTDLTLDEASGLAQHLADEGVISEPDDFAMWLYRAAAVSVGVPDGSTGVSQPGRTAASVVSTDEDDDDDDDEDDDGGDNSLN